MEQTLIDNVETINKLVNLIEIMGKEKFKRHIIAHLKTNSVMDNAHEKICDHIELQPNSKNSKALKTYKKIYVDKFYNT